MNHIPAAGQDICSRQRWSKCHWMEVSHPNPGTSCFQKK